MRRVVAALTSSLVACSLLTSLDDLRGGDASVGETSTDAPQCNADTSSDPHNCGGCGHDCCGGACAGGQCQPLVLASQQVDPGWVIADDTHVYWEINATNGLKQFPPPTTDIMRVRIDGTSLEPFARARPIFASVQSDSTRLIWMEASLQASPPFQIAWLDKSSVSDDAGDGGAVQTAAAVDPNATTAFMRGFVATKASTYWFASSSTECPGLAAACVYAAPNANLASYTVIHTSFAPYSIGNTSIDDRYIYPWTNDGKIYRVDTSQPDAGFPSDLIATSNVTIDAVDSTNVYWSDNSAGTIYSTPKVPSDASPTIFATLQNVPGDILAENGNVYWANADGIVTCPAAGCPNGTDKPRVLVAEPGITFFTTTPKCFYYASSSNGTIKVVGR